MPYTPRQAARMVDLDTKKFARELKKKGADMMKAPRIRTGFGKKR